MYLYNYASLRNFTNTWDVKYISIPDQSFFTFACRLS